MRLATTTSRVRSEGQLGHFDSCDDSGEQPTENPGVPANGRVKLRDAVGEVVV